MNGLLPDKPRPSRPIYPPRQRQHPAACRHPTFTPNMSHAEIDQSTSTSQLSTYTCTSIFADGLPTHILLGAWTKFYFTISADKREVRRSASTWEKDGRVEWTDKEGFKLTCSAEADVEVMLWREHTLRAAEAASARYDVPG
ncbi:hypothetical protein DACRYDRAFT_21863 [Dacryopinax primogenitus]|uniref:Uncharacterized protein n=1 Tax=Dacryopinax primogenitus (strain DJM 731) TaxID=1858805 RepID=M5FZZ1_DACPD|nr:uncharacterized protein DACRYDRAFT_21863 [Dacryopinax primogenitus]EJU02074.1 hypothetical protein DACRYDRAFT_21863 [Dacryopinax primogenitus]